MKRILKLLTFCLVTSLLISGCAVKEAERNAENLLKDGMAAYNSEDYEKAIADFKKLKEWYPFSKHVVIAEQKAADSYFKLEKYSEAIAAYQEFEKLHPKNELIPYINYQVALSHYLQIDTIDRDQKNARLALRLFLKLIKRHKNSKYAVEAEKKIKKCKESLAGHEFYVGEFYFKAERFKGALKRFENLVKIFPDSSYVKRAKEYIALCRKNIK